MEHYPLNEMKCVDISKTTISLRRAKSVIFASNLIPLDFAPPWMMHNLASHVKRIAHIAWIRNRLHHVWGLAKRSCKCRYRLPFTVYTISECIFSTMFSVHFQGASKENLFKNQELLSWWSFPSFSSGLGVTRAIRCWSIPIVKK